MAGSPVDSVTTLSPELQRMYQATLLMEKRPIQALNERKGDINKKVELLSDLIGKVDAAKKLLLPISTAGGLRELALASSDEKAVSGVVDKDVADPGTYNVEVLQLASRATAKSNGFPDKNETRVGTGYFTFETPTGESKEVFIDDEHSTLEGLSKLINKSNLGVQASVVSDQSDPEAPFRLLLSAPKTGVGQDPQYPEFYFLDGDEDFFIEMEKPAGNAILRYEGFEIETPTNEVKDLIKGVTLNLKGLTDPGKPITISIDQDVPKTIGKIKDFVEKMNAVFNFVQNQNKMDEKTQTRQTLGGDYGLRLTQDRIRNAIQTNVINDPERSIRSLGDMGIQFNRNGTLNFDEKKCEAAVKGHYEEVADLLSGDGTTYGIVPKLTQALGSISGTNNGTLTNEKKGFTDQVKRLDKKITETEKTVEKRAEVLRSKLGRVQGAMTAMQGQSAFFNAQAAATSEFHVGSGSPGQEG